MNAIPGGVNFICRHWETTGGFLARKRQDWIKINWIRKNPEFPFMETDWRRLHLSQGDQLKCFGIFHAREDEGYGNGGKGQIQIARKVGAKPREFS